MILIDLDPDEAPIVRRALVAVAESHQMEATNRAARIGVHDEHCRELRSESTVLERVAERIY